MRIPLFGVLRLTVLSAVALTLAAVAVSRTVPQPRSYCESTSSRYSSVNGAVFGSLESRNYLIDAEAGRLEPIDGGDADRTLQFASFAPWRNDDGERLAFGRLDQFANAGQSRMLVATSPAVLRWPDQRVVKAYEMAGTIASRACWLPGASTRAVFGTGDGRLQVVDLPSGDESDGDIDATYREPTPIAWKCDYPGAGEPFLGDPACPPIAELGGRVFVTLTNVRDLGGVPRYRRGEIWWLKLDPDSRTVVASGRLRDKSADDAHEGSREERLPNLTRTPDGRIVAAFLAKMGRSGWSLVLAPVRIDPATGAPSIDSARRAVIGEAGVTQPTFSPDGRWLYYVDPRLRPERALVRISVADAIDPVVKPLAAR